MKIKRVLMMVLLGGVLVTSLVASAQESPATSVPVEFIGAVEALNPGQLIVDQLPVNIASTVIPPPVQVGSFVRVKGTLQADGSIQAQEVSLLNAEPEPVAQQPVPAATLVPTVTLAVPGTVDASCLPGPDYWKTRPAEWPATVLTVGSQNYTQAELLNLLYAEPGADASLLLARQIVAAQLNILNGADGSLIQSTLAQASTLLQNVATFRGRLPYATSLTSTIGQQMVNAAGLLEQFNASVAASVCQAAATPDLTTSVVMEGKVDQIEGNRLSVNGLAFQLDPANPLLAALRLGDNVRIEGAFQDNGGTLLLVPASIQIARNVPTPPPVVNVSNNTASSGATVTGNPGGNNNRGMGDDKDKDKGMGNDKKDKDKDKGMGMGDD